MSRRSIMYFSIFFISVGQIIGILSYLYFDNPVLLLCIAPLLAALYFYKRAINLTIISCGILIGFVSIMYKTIIYQHNMDFQSISGTIKQIRPKHEGNKFTALIQIDDTSKYIKSTLDFPVKENSKIYGTVQLYNLPQPCLPNAHDLRYREYFSNVIAYGKMMDYRTTPTTQNDITEYIDSNFNNLESKLLQSLLLGKSYIMPQEIKKYFANSGLGHLLAISGMHIGIISLFFFVLCRWVIGLCVLPYFHAININLISKIFSVIGIAFYLQSINLSFASIRASIMFLLPIILAYHKKSSSMHNLFLTLSIMLLIWPEAIIYPDFQLSFISVFTLLHSIKTNSWIGGMLVSTLLCFISTLPIAAYWFQQITVQPFISNMVCVPLMFVIMPLLTSWFLLFKVGITFKILNSIISFFLSTLINLAMTFTSFLNTTLNFHQLHYIPVLLYLIGLFIISQKFIKKNQYINLLFFIPFIVNIYSKPKDCIVLGSAGEVAILKQGILYANKNNFMTSCWARTLGAQLEANNTENHVADGILHNHEIRVIKHKNKVQSIYVSERKYGRQFLQKCPCKVNI